jgi:hypothetical protein
MARPGRQGLFWTAMVLVSLVAVLDLARGSRSYLRGWWSSLHVTEQEDVRSQIEDFRDRRRR